MGYRPTTRRDVERRILDVKSQREQRSQQEKSLETEISNIDLEVKATEESNPKTRLEVRGAIPGKHGGSLVQAPYSDDEKQKLQQNQEKIQKLRESKITKQEEIENLKSTKSLLDDDLLNLKGIHKNISQSEYKNLTYNRAQGQKRYRSKIPIRKSGVIRLMKTPAPALVNFKFGSPNNRNFNKRTRVFKPMSIKDLGIEL